MYKEKMEKKLGLSTDCAFVEFDQFLRNAQIDDQSIEYIMCTLYLSKIAKREFVVSFNIGHALVSLFSNLYVERN